MNEISVESARAAFLHAAGVMRIRKGNVQSGELRACQALLRSMTEPCQVSASSADADLLKAFTDLVPELREGVKRGLHKVPPVGAKKPRPPSDAFSVCRLRFLFKQLKRQVPIESEIWPHIADVFEAMGEQLAPDVIASHAAQAAA